MAAAAVLFVLTASVSQFHFNATPATDLQPLFRPSSPWLGADCATSVPLPLDSHAGSGDDAYLWIFQDTFVGDMNADGTRRPRCMPHNSLGIARRGADGAWTLQHKVRGECSGDAPQTNGFFSPGNSSRWWWTETGLAVNGTDGKPRMIIFAQEMARPCEIGCTTTGIQLIIAKAGGGGGNSGNSGSDSGSGSAADVAGSWTNPESWQWSSHALPGWADGLTWPTGIAVADASGGAPSSPTAVNSFTRGGGTTRGGDQDPFLYLLGRDHAAGGWLGVLARVPLAAVLGGPSAWAGALQFWGADQGTPGSALAAPSWRPLPDSDHGGVRGLRLATIFDAAPPETSLYWSPAMQRWTVMSIPFGSNQLQMRWATRLIGPWSAPTTIYTIPPPWSLSPVFTYSPKMHPELVHTPAERAVRTNRSSEMVVTFMSNSMNASFVQAHTEVYVPQAVRVSVTVM
eukprot:g2204.t1